jgi:outer membrane protein assembly factor BamB
MASGALADDSPAWPRFRGLDGSGIAANGKPPADFGVDKNLLWKTELPAGVSSPVVAGDRVFVTGVEGTKLLTICLGRKDGKILWQREAPAQAIEKVHEFSSPAAATPATDGRRVYVYFGSYGLLAYEMDGAEAWKLPLARPVMDWGTATSPILVRGHVIQVCDGIGGGSYIVSVDAQSGQIAWKKPRLLFDASWSTPTVWKHAGIDDLIVLGSGRLVAYDPKDGSERWSVVGFPKQPIMSPSMGDGLIFAAVAGAGDPSDMVGQMPDFATMLKQYDANHDGKISPDEIPADAGIYLRKEVPRDAPGNFLPLRTLIQIASRGKGSISSLDWTIFQAAFRASGPVLMAIRPGGEGDVTESAIVWKTSRNVPELPSPLYYDGRLYLIRDGGRIACLDAKTGNVVFHGRLDAGGQYVASPVAADGKVYLCSEPGTVTVIKAGDKLEMLRSVSLGQRILATPAIVGDVLYVRTEKQLYAFGSSK